MRLHVMLDLETLATTADATVMSIGAVKFDPHSEFIDDNGFYASVSVESNLALGRRISEDTLIWWIKEAIQIPEARTVFTEAKQPLDAALEALSVWYGGDDLEVWSNGASFDVPILEHAYRQLDWEPPWKFWNSRCYRTYANMPAVRAANIKKPTARHNALLDAIDQAKTLQQMYAVVNPPASTKGKKPEVPGLRPR